MYKKMFVPSLCPQIYLVLKLSCGLLGTFQGPLDCDNFGVVYIRLNPITDKVNICKKNHNVLEDVYSTTVSGHQAPSSGGECELQTLTNGHQAPSSGGECELQTLTKGSGVHTLHLKRGRDALKLSWNTRLLKHCGFSYKFWSRLF